jgi:hypothetical protein
MQDGPLQFIWTVCLTPGSFVSRRWRGVHKTRVHERRSRSAMVAPSATPSAWPDARETQGWKTEGGGYGNGLPPATIGGCASTNRRSLGCIDLSSLNAMRTRSFPVPHAGRKSNALRCRLRGWSSAFTRSGCHVPAPCFYPRQPPQPPSGSRPILQPRHLQHPDLTH